MCQYNFQDHGKSASSYVGIIGNLKVRKTDESIMRFFEKFVIHDDYNSKNAENDIALIELSKTIAVSIIYTTSCFLIQYSEHMLSIYFLMI